MSVDDRLYTDAELEAERSKARLPIVLQLIDHIDAMKEQHRRELDEFAPIFQAYLEASEDAERLMEYMPLSFAEWLPLYIEQYKAMKAELKQIEQASRRDWS